MMPALLAYISIYYQLPALIVVISLVYSGTRYEEWNSILIEAFRWGIRMGGFLLGIGVLIYLVIIWVL